MSPFHTARLHDSHIHKFVTDKELEATSAARRPIPKTV